MLRLKKITMVFASFVMIAAMQSCESKLDLQPEDNRLFGDAAFAEPDAYLQAFAKLYAGLGITGQDTTGQPDIVSDDEGASAYLRSWWKCQELPTDEAVIGWNDGGIRDLNYQNWTAGNEFTRAAYGRFFFQVGIVNNFLRETTDDNSR